MQAHSFLQSPAWQEVQERIGRRTERVCGALVIQHGLPFGFHYWYAPRPTLDAPALEAIVARVRSSGAPFLKVDPLHPLPASEHRSVPAHPLQPAGTILIDCAQEEHGLFAIMHPKTRYNIRLAERHGVSVRPVPRPVSGADFNAFWELLRQTARRDGFHPHPVAHYRTLLDVGSDECTNELFLAEHRGGALAAALVNFYLPSKTATYLHGGSSREHRSLMAPHLLHWRIMQAVRARGFQTYDFGGTDFLRWPGVTRFKQGFGGRRHEFPPSVDYVFRPVLYHPYRFQHLLRHAPHP